MRFFKKQPATSFNTNWPNCDVLTSFPERELNEMAVATSSNRGGGTHQLGGLGGGGQKPVDGNVVDG